MAEHDKPCQGITMYNIAKHCITWHSITWRIMMVYAYTCVHVRKSIHPCMHACMHPSIHPSIHLSIYPSIHSIHLSIHTSIHPTIHTYIHTSDIHTSIHPYIHTSIHPYIHTSIHPYIHTYLHTYIHYLPTYVRTYVRSYVHTYIRTYVHTYIRTYVHTYVFICTYVYVCIYIYIVFTFLECRERKLKMVDHGDSTSCTSDTNTKWHQHLGEAASPKGRAIRLWLLHRMKTWENQHEIYWLHSRKTFLIPLCPSRKYSVFSQRVYIMFILFYWCLIEVKNPCSMAKNALVCVATMLCHSLQFTVFF